MKKPLMIILAITFVAMGIITVGAWVLYDPAKSGALPTFGDAPAFQLTDAQNQTFSSDQLKGKIWVADFFFTTCAGPCPTMSGNMQKLQEQFPGEDVKLVNFTVYPSHDTPEVMNRYGKKLKADPSRWHFLTGPEEEMMRISVGGFKIGDPDELFNHSKQFVLVDRSGSVRGYYDGTLDEDIQELARDIQALL